jgi:beta-barrel assembly-enhancing protease
MWESFYYDGKTADRKPVTVSFGARGLSIQHADGSVTLWPIEEVRQTQGAFASEQLRLERAGHAGEALLVMQPGLPEAIREAFPEQRTAVRGTRSTARLIAWSSGVIVSVVALYIWLTPLFTDWLSQRVPLAWEVSLGREVAERMAPVNRQCTDSTAIATVRLVLDRLQRAAPANRYSFQLTVLNDTTVNAFAMPGGYMTVFSGLLATTTTAEQFAGVLAHEMQHVLLRHTTRGIIREMPLQIAVSAIAGGSGLDNAVAVAGTLNSLRYRRADESAADREGMRLMEAAGIDPNGMVEVMRSLEKLNDDAPRFVSYLSSHPQTQERVAALEALARESRVVPTPLMDAATWQHVRRACSATN